MRVVVHVHVPVRVHVHVKLTQVMGSLKQAYLQEVDLLRGNDPKAVAQALLISASLDGAGQQLHCIVGSLSVVHALLHAQPSSLRA